MSDALLYPKCVSITLLNGVSASLASAGVSA